jgi:hypothetical protein
MRRKAIQPARRPPEWVDTMFTLYDTRGHPFLDEICRKMVSKKTSAMRHRK